MDKERVEVGVEHLAAPKASPNVAVSALRGLAAAGYFSQAQLASMEGIILGRGEADAASAGKRWLSIAEACRHAKVSRTTLWRYERSGKFPIHCLGGRRLVAKDELDAFILSGPPPADKLRRRP